MRMLSHVHASATCHEAGAVAVAPALFLRNMHTAQTGEDGLLNDYFFGPHESDSRFWDYSYGGPELIGPPQLTPPPDSVSNSFGFNPPTVELIQTAEENRKIEQRGWRLTVIITVASVVGTILCCTLQCGIGAIVLCYMWRRQGVKDACAQQPGGPQQPADAAPADGADGRPPARGASTAYLSEV